MLFYDAILFYSILFKLEMVKQADQFKIVKLKTISKTLRTRHKKLELKLVLESAQKFFQKCQPDSSFKLFSTSVFTIWPV